MRTKVKNINACARIIEIEVHLDELSPIFDQVYMDIRKVARIAGFRPGKAPRDLLEIHYRKKAEEEVIKRAIPEYYLRAVEEQNLTAVAGPVIENVQLKDHSLYFSARIDVRPQVKLKTYKNLRIIKKKAKVEQSQLDEALERLRRSKVKGAQVREDREKKRPLPELTDVFAQGLGFKSLQDLKQVISQNLQANAEIEVKADLERQILGQLLERAYLDLPQLLLEGEQQELLKQIKLNRILQGAKKQALDAQEQELQTEAKTAALRKVKLSFILEEIAQRENIQINQTDLEEKIEEIAQRSAKDKVEVRAYLQRENLMPSLKAELSSKKTVGFLLKEAKVEEEK